MARANRLICTMYGTQGLSQMIHDDQPTFSLVSNGAECILINKKFYMDNVSKELMNVLRMEVAIFLLFPGSVLSVCDEMCVHVTVVLLFCIIICIQETVHA